MIYVNKKAIIYNEGMTVADAISKSEINTDSMTIVMVDGKVMSVNELDSELVDEVKVKVLTVLSGG